MADHSRPDIQSIQETALKTARSGRNMFITGSAGTGKSSLERILTKDAQSRGLNVTLAAPTGIAAEAIGGCTIHRLLGLSGALMEISGSGKPSLVRGSTKNLRGTDLLIIDEISMVSLPLFDILALTLDAADKEGHPVQLIVSGDFYQLPPVISPVEKASLSSIYPDTGRTYAFESVHWEKFNFHTVLLEQNFRQADPGFSTLLARLRTGDRSALPAFLALTSRKLLRNALWICGRKADAAARNNTGLEELGGIPSVYHAVTQGILPEDSLPAPLSLTVRPHMPVMMTVNDPRGRFCNGSRGYVVSSGADCILADTAGKNSWNLTTGAIALAADVTFGGKTIAALVGELIPDVSSALSTALEAYDQTLDQDEILDRLTDGGEDTGLYLGQDGCLHMLPERVITGEMNIPVAYLPTTIVNGEVTSFTQVRVANGVIYPPISHTITYYDEDGVTVLGSEQVVSGQDCTLVPEPEKEGYTFLGWTDAVGGTADSTLLESITADNDLYAVYELENGGKS